MNSLPKRSPTCLLDIFSERARIARELHDGIAQELAAIGYALDSEIGRTDVTESARKSLRAIREQITELNSTVRQEIFLLRSKKTQTPHDSLEEAMSSLDLHTAIEGTLPDSGTGMELFKVLLELSRNSLSHGKASNISLRITPTQITFDNDGSASTPVSALGFGLKGVVERLNSVGWKIISDADFKHIELSEQL